MSDESKFTVLLQTPDELKFVDADIADEFRGKNYILGTPTQIQHSRVMDRFIFRLSILMDRLEKAAE